MTNLPTESIHHVTPLSNILLGRQECNKLRMDHTDHISLHKTCDLDKDMYPARMDELYASINSDLLLSLSSIDTLYEHLEYFFDNYEKLPDHVKIDIGKKWKQIAMYHLNQWPQITNTDGDNYWKLHRSEIEKWGDILTSNDMEYIMMQDKSIVKDLMLHVFRRLKKHGFNEDILYGVTQPTTEQYMIPLRMRGKNTDSNQVSIKSHIYEHIGDKIKGKGGINLRGARDQTNGSYIFGSEEWKRWYEPQHKYLIKLEEVVDDYYGVKIRDIYLKKMSKQLFDTIGQWNTIQNILGEDNTYKQKSRSFHGMHEEMTKVSGMMGDRLKKLLLDEYCFL